MAEAGCCLICGRAEEPRYRPFCSARCADVDLGRWLTERYRLPARDDDEAEPKPETETNHPSA